MSRWLWILICALALAGSVSAQDDLDALLAGLGDEPVAADMAAPAEVSTPAEAPVAEMAPAVEDPFADLLSPTEDLAVEATVEEIPADAFLDEAAADDPFADLVDNDWEADETPEIAEIAAAPADEPALEEISAVESDVDDPFADLLSPTEVMAVEADIEEIPAETLATEADVEDPFADLLGDEPETEEVPAIVDPIEETMDEPIAEEIPVAEDSIDDLLGDDWAEESAASDVLTEEESDELPAAPESDSIDDVNAALGILSDAAEEKAPATVEGAFVVAPAKEAKMPKAKIDMKDEKEKTPAPKTDLKPRVADKVPEWNQPVVW